MNVVPESRSPTQYRRPGPAGVVCLWGFPIRRFDLREGLEKGHDDSLNILVTERIRLVETLRGEPVSDHAFR